MISTPRTYVVVLLERSSELGGRDLAVLVGVGGLEALLGGGARVLLGLRVALGALLNLGAELWVLDVNELLELVGALAGKSLAEEGALDLGDALLVAVLQRSGGKKRDVKL